MRRRSPFTSARASFLMLAIPNPRYTFWQQLVYTGKPAYRDCPKLSSLCSTFCLYLKAKQELCEPLGNNSWPCMSTESFTPTPWRVPKKWQWLSLHSIFFTGVHLQLTSWMAALWQQCVTIPPLSSGWWVTYYILHCIATITPHTVPASRRRS